MKQLLPLGSLTVIEHTLNTILSAGVTDIVVVAGPDGGDVTSAINHMPVTIALNPDSQSDMAASVRAGLNELKDPSSSVLVCPVDHPLVFPTTIKVLLARHQEHPDAIIIPSYNRRRGHPTLFPRIMIQEIFGANSLRDIIAAHSEMIVYENTEDEGVVLDMDMPEDYERIQRKYRQRR